MHQPSSPAAQRTARLAFAALILSNIFLAMGPWMVRLTDVGPVAAASGGSPWRSRSCCC
jgi:hypothetical protein